MKRRLLRNKVYEEIDGKNQKLEQNNGFVGEEIYIFPKVMMQKERKNKTKNNMRDRKRR